MTRVVGPELRALGAWRGRQWGSASAVAAAYALVVAVPTDLVDTPVFSREIPPTWWAWPSLLVSSALVGLLVATYVGAAEPDEDRKGLAGRRGGWAGGLLTFFAVGCPVCNKIVLVVLGASGAMTWFAPLQPLLQVVAVGLLLWGLRVRLRGQIECPLPDLTVNEQGEVRA